jgi:pyridoxamine 5'-phosphate oxidase
LTDNPRASACFWWPHLKRQVRFEGQVELVSDREADEYFASRPRGSQIGAWASRQSAALPSREALEERVERVSARFADQPVPRPPFWGGYRLCPQRIEFWHGRESRLHDRLLYERDGDGWRESRLSP